MSSTDHPAREKLSVVIPIFNEGEQLEVNLAYIVNVLNAIDYDLEMILVDDGSKDTSSDVISDFSVRHDFARSVMLARNFGKEAAIHAGIAHATGAGIVVMDSDLQHPPELIDAMIKAWEGGALVVEAVKIKRNDERYVDRASAAFFYKLYGWLSGFDITNHSDFKLIDRSVANLYLQMSEKHRFFRGLVHWMGIDGVQIPFEVSERAGGETRWTKIALAKYALGNISSFTTLPLHIITVLGIVTVMLGSILGIWTIFYKLLGVSAEGFTTVNVLLIIFGGSIMLSLGIIGHYIGKIYEEVKGRPSYVIKPESSVFESRDS